MKKQSQIEAIKKGLAVTQRRYSGRLQPFDGGLGAGIAPQRGLVLEGRQSDIDTFQRFQEDGPRAPEIPLPTAWTIVAVEYDPDTLFTRHADQDWQPGLTI